MTTALQQLLAEIDAAPAGCLDDVRRWVRTLAVEMMQVQDWEPPAHVDPYSRDEVVTLLRRDVSEWRDHAKDVEVQRDIARRDLAASLHDLDIVCKERNAARAEVARLQLMVNEAQKRAREDAERETVTAIVDSLNHNGLRVSAEFICSGNWRKP